MVQGLDRLNRRWTAIPRKVRQAVKAEMESLADQIVADMKRLAPKDQMDLANSIGWTWGKAPAGAMTIGSFGGGSNYGTMRVTLYAGGEATTDKKGRDYAKFQEFGTVNMAANPFFFPVWRVWKRRVRTRINKAIRQAVKAG